MGAIVAHEVAQHLRAIGAQEPTHLYVSARAAPQLQNNGDPLRFLNDEEFMDRLHKAYGAVPEAIRNSAELQSVFLPILRADVELLETHVDISAAPLDYPITAFGGASDPAISAAMLAGWRERTNSDFAQHEFAGDHFFIHAQHEGIMAIVGDDLSPAR